MHLNRKPLWHLPFARAQGETASVIPLFKIRNRSLAKSQNSY